MNGLGKQEGRRRLNHQHIPAHTHEYVQHPTWGTHMACAVCGLSVSKVYLQTAINQGAIVSSSLTEV